MSKFNKNSYKTGKNFKKLQRTNMNNFMKGSPLVSLLKIVDVGKVTLNSHQKPNQFTL